MESPQKTHVRQHYNKHCEDSVNRHINLELHTYYVYLSMAHFLDREDVPLKNFSQLLLCLSSKAREQAEKLMELQNLRGGLIKLENVQKPDDTEWNSSLQVLECALSLVKRVNKSLINLYDIANDSTDAHLRNFLGRHFLQQQVQSLKELSDLINTQRKLGSQGCAEFLLDNLTLGGGSKN
ncbi:ferritin heavy chain-like [Erinaceus europaeus]|uniref:Ferritin n=1 Tax=Erinaceus europaeus TaxID=9365 RepID=A0A1S3AQF0_ERIEU|nr:ferritin heavy chain-like [Erinaceus europaeus]